MEPRRGRWSKTAVSLPEVGTDDATAAPTGQVDLPVPGDDSDDEGFWGELPPARACPAEIAEPERAVPVQVEPLFQRPVPPQEPRHRSRLSQKQRKQQSWENQTSWSAPAEQARERPSSVPQFDKPDLSQKAGYAARDLPSLRRGPGEQRDRTYQVDHDVELDPGAEDERSVLEAIYGNEFEILGPNEWRIVLPGAAGAPSAAVRFLLPAGYPRSGEPPVPLFDCEGASQGLRHAATEAVAELVENWQPPEEGEGCIYQWVERLRECLEPALAAEVLQRDELDAAFAQSLAVAEEAAAAQAATSKSFTFLPANPQYGQRRRVFDAASFDDANAVEILRGESFVDRKSTFQGFAAKVSNQGQVNWVLRTLLEDRKIAVATHNMFAYRFRDDDRKIQVADNEDDGEDGAGSKLAELLNLAGCEDVFVMVSRWYGGIHLGPDRFKHIARAASVLLDEAGWSSRGRGASSTDRKSVV